MAENTFAASLKEGREECLEALYRLERKGEKISWEALEENSDLGGIDLPVVLLDLVERGNVELGDGTIRINRSGRAIGKRIYRRHEFAERFFRLLGLKRARAHQEACRFEHIISLPDDVSDPAAILERLNRGAVPLTRASIGVSYRLEMVYGGRGARRKLEDMGVGPGALITPCGRQPGGPVQITVRGSRLALGRGIAAKVLVVPAESIRTNEPAQFHHNRGGTRHRHRE